MKPAKNYFVIFLMTFTVCYSEIKVTKRNYRIGSFNIQSFGVSKMEKQWVVEILSQIVSKFDIITIQELRDSTGKVIKNFKNLVNKHAAGLGRNFSVVVSDRLGTTNWHQEQYVFFYDKKRVELLDTFQYTDEEQSFARPPFFAKFHLKESSVPVVIIAANHLSPNTVSQELRALSKAHRIIENRWNNNDIILAGDFNADCTYLNRYDFENSPLRSSSKFDWLITSCHRTTAVRSACIYDHFVISGDELKKFGVVPGSAKVYKFDEILALNYTEALDVSDHYPIEFEIAGKSELSKELDNTAAQVFEVSQRVPNTKLNIIRAIYLSEKLTPEERDYFEILLLKKGTANHKVTASKRVNSKAIAWDSIQNFISRYSGLFTNDTVAIIKSFFEENVLHRKFPHSLSVSCHRRGSDCDLYYLIQFECTMHTSHRCSLSMKQVYEM